MSITKTQLKKGYRGDLWNGSNYIGGVYLIEGKGLVLNVEYGRVIAVLGTHEPKAFRKVGSTRVSASQSVTNWELRA